MCVLPHSGNAWWLHEVPVFQTVVDYATVEWVVIAAIGFLEVPITVVVGFLVGRDVTDDHIEL